MSIFQYKDLYNDSNVPITRNIFCEWKSDALLTVDRNGKDGKVCLYKLYMLHAVDDPSEVTFVEEVFGDMYFWQKLSESPWFGPILEEWRHFAAVKRKQVAFKAIIDEVKTKGRSSFTAAKYLIEEPWKFGPATERKKTRKRISDSAEEAFKDSTVQADLARLREEGMIQ